MVYRNDYQGARFSEDDLAVVSLLCQMTSWCRGEAPEPYSLADGCQDHLLSLAIEESVRTGTSVTHRPRGLGPVGARHGAERRAMSRGRSGATVKGAGGRDDAATAGVMGEPVAGVMSRSPVPHSPGVRGVVPRAAVRTG